MTALDHLEGAVTAAARGKYNRHRDEVLTARPDLAVLGLRTWDELSATTQLAYREAILSVVMDALSYVDQQEVVEQAAESDLVGTGPADSQVAEPVPVQQHDYRLDWYSNALGRLDEQRLKQAIGPVHGVEILGWGEGSTGSAANYTVTIAAVTTEAAETVADVLAREFGQQVALYLSSYGSDAGRLNPDVPEQPIYQTGVPRR